MINIFCDHTGFINLKGSELVLGISNRRILCKLSIAQNFEAHSCRRRDAEAHFKAFESDGALQSGDS